MAGDNFPIAIFLSFNEGQSPKGLWPCLFSGALKTVYALDLVF